MPDAAGRFRGIAVPQLPWLAIKPGARVVVTRGSNAGLRGRVVWMNGDEASVAIDGLADALPVKIWEGWLSALPSG